MDNMVERHAFRKDNLWKVKTIRGLYLAKFPLFNEHLSQIKTKFGKLLLGYSAESKNFARIVLHAFTQDNPRKVITFPLIICGKFQYTAKSQNFTCLRPITTSKANSDKNSTMGYQYVL